MHLILHLFNMDSQIQKTILCHFRKAIDFNAIENNESET